MRTRLTIKKGFDQAGEVMRGRRKQGQATVEMALLGFLMVLLLAAAVDFGRAFYTSVVVTNMAGEGAAYASIFPDADINFPTPYNSSNANRCSDLGVTASKNIQDRARKVAEERGIVIKEPSQAAIVITPASCLSRCAGNTITVRVTYRIDDLFLPGILGMNNLTITKSATRPLERSSYAAQVENLCTANP